MTTSTKLLGLPATLIFMGLLSSCSTAQPNCSGGTVVTILPAATTADHMAIAPGDQTQFVASSSPAATATGSGCASPSFNAKLTPDWTVSDTINVKISSAKDSTNGLATCIGTTKSPVTVTATGSLVSGGPTQILGTATLGCK